MLSEARIMEHLIIPTARRSGYDNGIYSTNVLGRQGRFDESGIGCRIISAMGRYVETFGRSSGGVASRRPSPSEFTGQYAYTDDPSTLGVTEGFGLMFFNARWMDPSLGRFAQPDSIVPTQTQGTQAWDRYAFVNNNPVRYNDPTGHNVPPPWLIAALTPFIESDIYLAGVSCIGSVYCVDAVVAVVVVIATVAALPRVVILKLHMNPNQKRQVIRNRQRPHQFLLPQSQFHQRLQIFTLCHLRPLHTLVPCKI